MRPSLLAVLAALAFAAPALGLDGRTLRVDDGRLVDRHGNEVTLRGVNARVAGVFDASFDDGRLPLEDIPGFDDGDAARMHDLGFNLLRLPISWSALEPVRGTYDQAYLERIAAVVAACRRAGILVLLDFHQDAFSKEIGEDGAPRWVLDLLLGPDGYPYLGGPLTDLGARRLAPWTLKAFQTFFDDLGAIQDDFAAAAAVVARRFRRDPGVLGYETMNEPLAFLSRNGAAKLDAFHARVTQAIRGADRRHLVAFEPDALRNLTNQAPVPAAPFGDARGLYAPHVYTGVFDGQTYTGDASLLAPSMERAAAEAVAWGTPLLVGEYGIDPGHPFANEWITQQLDLQDRLRAHSTFWVWEETSQGHWGLFAGESSEPGGERLARTTALSRVYARRVPGRVLEHAFDAAANTLLLRYVARRAGRVELFVPARRYPGGVVVRCDGAEVEGRRDARRGTLAVPCPGRGVEHVVELVPAS